MSKCDKDTKVFNRKDWDIEVEYATTAESYKGDNWVNGDIYAIHVTKKKPQSKLEWRDITPLFGYSLLASHGTANQLSLEYPQKWQENYFLIQFRLTHEKGFPMVMTEHIKSCARYRNEVSNFENDVKLFLDSHNQYSIPIVMPVVFFNKLDEYVAEFNRKLNE